jgi:hypothetical protein
MLETINRVLISHFNRRFICEIDQGRARWEAKGRDCGGHAEGSTLLPVYEQDVAWHKGKLVVFTTAVSINSSFEKLGPYERLKGHARKQERSDIGPDWGITPECVIILFQLIWIF